MRVLLRISALLLILSAFVGIVVAQGTNDRVLTPEVPVNGVLDVNNPAQIYRFDANAGDAVNLTLSSGGPSLTMFLSNSLGNQLSTATTNGGNATLSYTVEAAGTHYVTVFPSPAGTADVTNNFTITLAKTSVTSPVAEVTPQLALPPTAAPVTQIDPATFSVDQVSLTGGIQVSLTWNTNDDLNLQVRDPAGTTLFWDSRSTPDGGVFGADVNGLCEIINTPPNIETATWTGGALPEGSYEILVYYRQACEDTAAPVPFTVNVTVDGQALAPVTGTLAPPVNDTANVYLGSFTINADGTSQLGAQGAYTDTRVLPIPIGEILTNPATPLTSGQSVDGVITNENFYQTYTFSGQAGESVTIDMTATEGSLDTLLLVLNSSGNIIADNDDIAVANNTNSRVEGLRLPATGTYTVFASRYGKDVAGTEGVYTISLNATDATLQSLGVNLPVGDIEVTLRWSTNADLQLLVRDPFGTPVFDDNTRAQQSGGELVSFGNRDCVTSATPIYYIYWPQGFLRIGAYEIEVWYQSDCGDTRPVIADLYVTIQGQSILRETISIDFGQRYVTSFNITQSGEVTTYAGGIIGGSELIPFGAEAASAIAVGSGDTITGSITLDNKFDIYVFEGQVNDNVNIRMTANSATLDTSLYLIDPSGVEIARNDDIVAGENTNSAITNVRLTQPGTYTIVATHFGGPYGGTIGGYTLSLNIVRTVETQDDASEPSATNLP